MGRRGRGTNPHPQVVARQTKFVLTNEDWYPTIDGMMRVSMAVRDDGACWVVVSGDDDFDMSIDLDDEGKVRCIFDCIVDLTTKEELRSFGLR